MATSRATGAFDVVVIGAGPAGSAIARWLALAGCRVALLERTRFEHPRIGESLAPEVQPLLRDLGVWDDFLALRPLPSWGTRSAWGEALQRTQSHVFSPYHCGWHVDRCAFDRLLASRAEAAGVSVLEGTAWIGSESQADGWQVRVQAVAGPAAECSAPVRTLATRFIVDATGRRAQVARHIGARVVPFDRLVAVSTQTTDCADQARGHLLIEAVRDGWWYSAPLPSGAGAADPAMIVMLMTDADLCAQAHLNRPAPWQAHLAATAATRQRLATAHPLTAPQVRCAGSQRLSRAATAGGRAWLAVGDAALAVDPISGSGVVRALRSARAAADVVLAANDKPNQRADAMATYESERDRECIEFLATRAQYYALEQRWCESPFWRRRQAPANELLRAHTQAPPTRAAAIAGAV